VDGSVSGAPKAAINVYKLCMGRTHCLLRKQVDGSSMALLGNTQDDDMRLIAEMTISRLEAMCTASPSTTPVTGRQAKSVDIYCRRTSPLLLYL